MEKNRIETGIPGLDKLIQGGFIEGSTILLCGGTGTGKTIFSCQFIWHGLEKGENGVYLTLEEDKENIIKCAQDFGWDFKKYINQKKLIVESIFPSSLEEIKDTIRELIRRVDAKRFVLDSLSVATMGWKESESMPIIRRGVFELARTLKDLHVTSILISEIPEGKINKLSRLGVEEFVVDGIIRLHYLELVIGNVPRSLIIRKMRRTKHETDIFPFEITEKGIIVKKA
ncbi:MAG: ATPase domain-containing protein [Candidatus Aenigmatarchaeota archaeon]